MTVVPGRLRFAFRARLMASAALGPPTSVGAVCSPQAASSDVSAEVTIKSRCIGVLLCGNGCPCRVSRGRLRCRLIPVDGFAYHFFLLIGDCLAAIQAWLRQLIEERDRRDDGA